MHELYAKEQDMVNSSHFGMDQYQLILDSLSEGVCTVDRAWNITSFNRAAQKLTGVPAEKAIGLPFGDIFRCEVCHCQSLLRGIMENGQQVHDVNTQITDSKDKPMPVSLNAAPFCNEHGDIDGLVATFRNNRPIETLRKELRHTFTFGDIVSKSDQILRILDILPNVADSDSPVLVTGPSGTGKELLVRAIHNASPRRSRPFVAVNCGALPDNLLESELFGYKKGAFTDAKSDKLGRFALAEGGTLFLDEIGDISQAMQVKLLRVVQEKIYEPLGATISVSTNVRIVAATNRNLRSMVEMETFRSDLYYRLNVVGLEVPSLADRREDIPLLVDHFMERLNAEKGRSITHISPRAMERLMRYDYPGNVRELQNIIERAYILCRYDEIREECLPPSLLEAAGPATNDVQPNRFVNLRSLDPEEEETLIRKILAGCGGNRKKAASQLGINPSTLWRKMKKYSIIVSGGAQNRPVIGASK